MIKTPDLIASLATNLAPVRRLRPPVARATYWLLLALAVLIILAVGLGVRSDLAQRLSEPMFALCMIASLLTGVLAAVAACLVSLPDRSRFWVLLPAPAFIAWAWIVGYQCLVRWISIGPNGIGFGDAARCCATVVLTSLPLSLAMLLMLRYAAPMRPTAVIFMGSLAVAAITATALALFLAINASIMILILNCGTAALFIGMGGAFGRALFRWVAPKTLRRGDETHPS
jgi:hypothetical protein